MGHDNGRKAEEERLRREAEAAKAEALAAKQKAETPDPFETRMRERANAIEDWRTSKDKPMNIYNFPGQEAIALYKAAKTSRDAGRIGRGLATLSDGANPNFGVALDKEMQLERDVNASGMLEDSVNSTLATNDALMGNLANMGNSRSMWLADFARSLAGDARGAWEKLRDKPKEPSFLKQLALGAVNNFKYAAGGLTI
ncbi:MAG TPA: hypothetical protein VJS44_08440 [Pyrinomonadaceae bacterium]|nr:hypothetical protein [Pyrinomonadaceae bacterium]